MITIPIPPVTFSVSPASLCRRPAGMEKPICNIGKNIGDIQKKRAGNPARRKLIKNHLLLIPYKKNLLY